MPSCLPACTSYPAGHRLWLAVFIPWLRVRGHGFSFGYFADLAALRDDTLYMASGGFIVNATGDPQYAECNLEYCEEYIKCDTLPE